MWLPSVNYFQNIFITPKRNSIPINLHLPSNPWHITNLLPASLDFPILDISYKWNHMLHDFLSGFFQLACVHPCMHQHFIPLYGGIFHCMGTPYFVCTNGHFGCFYILAIVNKAYKYLCTIIVSTAISVLLVIFLQVYCWFIWRFYLETF